MPADATCYLRTGYRVQGLNRVGSVTAHETLVATVRWDSGEQEEVDQFEHGLLVIDRGEPLWVWEYDPWDDG
jgi:hypothetical protein